jgi:30S ribosomal protein S31
MGRGDKRTKRGKIFSGSYGKTRSRKPKVVAFKKKETTKTEAK